MADLVLSHPDRESINGAVFKLDEQKKPDKVMRDREFGRRLWAELVLATGLEAELKQAS